MTSTDEKNKGFWRSSWRWRRGFRIWLSLVAVALCVTAATLILMTLLSSTTSYLPSDNWEWLAVCLYCVGGATALFCLVIFIRWICCWRNFRRFLWGLAYLAVLIVLFYAEEDWRGWHSWNKFKSEWEAKGERFDFASFIPPPVPDDQNFALTPIVVSCYEKHLDKDGHQIKPPNTNIINRLKMSIYHDESDWPNWPTNRGDWQKAKPIDLRDWQQYYRSRTGTNSYSIVTNLFPITPQPQSPAADVLLALSKYDSAIEELRQASRLPYSRFPLDYGTGNPIMIGCPHLDTLRNCVLVLQLRAIAELKSGQTEKALADIKLSLRLSDSIRSEPLLISHLFRIGNERFVIQPIWEGLVEHKWSDSQLVELEEQFGKQDYLRDYQSCMRAERAYEITAIEYLRRHRNYQIFAPLFRLVFDDHVIPRWDNFVGTEIYCLMPRGWFHKNELAMAKTYQSYAFPILDPASRLASPEMARKSTAFEYSILTKPWMVFGRVLLAAVGDDAKKFAYGQESADLARVAIALERYQLAHGEYPETLDVLAPQFIDKLPHDIINGQPLHYRRTDDGQFVLYSVGWNEKDDGGVVGLRESSSVDMEKGDWVWRYPAK